MRERVVAVAWFTRNWEYDVEPTLGDIQVYIRNNCADYATINHRLVLSFCEALWRAVQ